MTAKLGDTPRTWILIAVLVVGVSSLTSPVLETRLLTNMGMIQVAQSLVDGVPEEESLYYLRRVHRLDHMNSSAVYGLGLLDLREQDWVEGVESMENAIASGVRDRRVLWLLGRFYEEIGSYRQAIEVWQAAGLSWEIERLAETLRDLGYRDVALEAYTALVSIRPRHAQYFYQRGLLWWQADEVEKARSDFSQTVELDPQFPLGHIWMGNSYRLVGDCSSAMKYYERAIRADRRYWRAYYYLGICEASNGDTEDAMTNFRQALVLDPLGIDVQFQLAEIYESSGMIKLAIAQYLQVLQFDINNAQTKAKLARLMGEER